MASKFLKKRDKMKKQNKEEDPFLGIMGLVEKEKPSKTFTMEVLSQLEKEGILPVKRKIPNDNGFIWIGAGFLFLLISLIIILIGFIWAHPNVKFGLGLKPFHRNFVWNDTKVVWYAYSISGVLMATFLLEMFRFRNQKRESLLTR